MTRGLLAIKAVALGVAIALALPATALADLYINAKGDLRATSTVPSSCSKQDQNRMVVCENSHGALGNFWLNASGNVSCVVSVFNNPSGPFHRRWHIELRGSGCKYHWHNDNTVDISHS